MFKDLTPVSAVFEIFGKILDNMLFPQGSEICFPRGSEIYNLHLKMLANSKIFRQVMATICQRVRSLKKRLEKRGHNFSKRIIGAET